MRAYIKAISYYLPDDVLANEDLSYLFPEWTAEKVASKVGIKKRHISGDNETATDMAFKAALKLFEEHSVNKSDIDFVLFCTQSPDYYLPSSSCILQDKLGLNKRCGAFDFNLGCSGFIYGLAVAKGLLSAGIAKNILLITSETYTKHIHPEDKGNRTIFGDAASAILISDEGIGEINEFVLGTDGSGYDQLIVKNGGLRNHSFTNEFSLDEEGNIHAPDYLYMNGTEIFAFTIREVPPMVDEVLIANGLKNEEIDLFIFHQANKFMLTHLQKRLKIDEEKFFVFMEDVGNTVSCTIPIALYEALKQNKIKKGNKILLAGYGVGLSWGGVVITH
jgi:3-oxoacyl-[acyl-carrier-protein] synthase III